MVEIWLLFSLVLPFLEVILQSYIHYILIQALYLKQSALQSQILKKNLERKNNTVLYKELKYS